MSAKIVVPVMTHEHHTGCECYSYEEMADYFANELYQLDNTITVICTIQTKKKGE